MKKIGLICLALVLALGALGVGAAFWWGLLTIHGDVNTGSIYAEWSIEGVSDDETKDVSNVTAELVEPWHMLITINNAYPSVTYTVYWNIQCLGSVPIHFREPFITSNLTADATFTFTDMVGANITWPTVQLHPGDPPFLGMLTVHLGNDAEPNAWYVFDIFLEYGQYNEEFPAPAPPPPPES